MSIVSMYLGQIYEYNFIGNKSQMFLIICRAVFLFPIWGTLLFKTVASEI